MTAKHVTERLSEESNWFIVVNNQREHAFLINALIDCNYMIKYNYIKYIGVYKHKEEIHHFLYKELRYVDDLCENISDWFFKEVNNH